MERRKKARLPAKNGHAAAFTPKSLIDGAGAFEV
jgi:hypothetical protein